MKRKNYHRWLALLLAVSMTLTTNGGFAFAAEDAPLVDAVDTVDTTIEPAMPEGSEASEEAPDKDGEQKDLSDPEGSDVTLSGEGDNEPVCTCDPAPGASGVEGYNGGCPLYVAPEPPEDEQGECTCPPVDSGEMVHIEGCPRYEKPAEPETKCACMVLCTADAVNADCPICGLGFEKCAYAAPAPSEATLAVYALTDALPTMDELGAMDTEGAEFPAFLEKLRTDTAAARTAYDALTDEEKTAFDAARLEKLTAIEGLFGVSTMAAVSPPATTQPKGTGTQADPWQVGSQAEWA